MQRGFASRGQAATALASFPTLDQSYAKSLLQTTQGLGHRWLGHMQLLSDLTQGSPGSDVLQHQQIAQAQLLNAGGKNIHSNAYHL